MSKWCCKINRRNEKRKRKKEKEKRKQLVALTQCFVVFLSPFPRVVRIQLYFQKAKISFVNVRVDDSSV